MSPLDVSSFPDTVQLPIEEGRPNSGSLRSRKRRLFGSLLGGSKDVAQLLRAPRRRASEASVQVLPIEPEPQTVLDLRSSETPLDVHDAVDFSPFKSSCHLNFRAERALCD